ncbi:MAG: hypothetical protein AAB591_00500 [Patescibacteria group bacterium]
MTTAIYGLSEYGHDASEMGFAPIAGFCEKYPWEDWHLATKADFISRHLDLLIV